MNKLVAKFDHVAGNGGACCFFAQPFHEDNQAEKLQALLRSIRQAYAVPRLIVDDLTGYGDPVYAMEQARGWVDEYRDDLDMCGMTETMQTLGTFLGTREFTAYRDAITQLSETDGSFRNQVNEMADKIMALDTFQARCTARELSQVETARAAQQDAVLKLSSLFTLGTLFGARPVIYNGARPSTLAVFQQKLADTIPVEFPAVMSASFKGEDAATTAQNAPAEEADTGGAKIIDLFGARGPRP